MKDNRYNILSIMSQKLRASYQLIRLEMDSIGLEKLDISHGDILFQLFSKGDMSMKSLSQSISKDKSTVTALVKKMISMDLIERKQDHTDGRASIIALTQKGESFRKNFEEISTTVIERLYKNMNYDEQMQLIGLLEKLNS